MSHLGDNLADPGRLPLLEHPTRVEANAAVRYALNYVTFNYSFLFATWADWERELDWMALSGVNLMLVANGEEAVWQRTLRRLGYSDHEIAAFIPGPAYTAWWLMGNLEGTGGPMSQGMIDRRSDLKRHLIARMRELGIEPLVPGFYGMVPTTLPGKVHARILDQGKWQCFQRPSILDPNDPQFARVAAIYYEEVKALYGAKLKYFSGDPFHEGGNFSGVDLPHAGVAIQKAMQAAFPGSTWVLQGWYDNPLKELIEGTDRPHLLVQELMGEATRNWETRHAYEGTPFLWCCVNNFGEKPGVFGGLQRYADETYRVRTSPYASYYKGVGFMSEGIFNNPVAYDLALELGWHQEHVDVARWLPGYIRYRYGRDDLDLEAAWSGLLKTAYTFENANGPENVLCSRPAHPVHTVSTWGSLKIGYDPSVFSGAVDRFCAAAERFNGSETYRLDRLPLLLQRNSNTAFALAQSIDRSLDQRDRKAFEAASKAFLALGLETERLVDTEPRYRLESYRQRALAYGETPEEKAICVRSAMALISYWGGDDRSHDELHDYACKALAGMMGSYDVARWRAYFEAVERDWDRPQTIVPDFYAWERQWAERASQSAAP